MGSKGAREGAADSPCTEGPATLAGRQQGKGRGHCPVTPHPILLHPCFTTPKAIVQGQVPKPSAVCRLDELLPQKVCVVTQKSSRAATGAGAFFFTWGQGLGVGALGPQKTTENEPPHRNSLVLHPSPRTQERQGDQTQLGRPHKRHPYAWFQVQVQPMGLTATAEQPQERLGNNSGLQQPPTPTHICKPKSGAQTVEVRAMGDERP